jgi:hypothetical protein
MGIVYGSAGFKKEQGRMEAAWKSTATHAAKKTKDDREGPECHDRRRDANP